MARYTNKEFWSAVRRLRTLWPLPYPTRIRTVAKLDNQAEWKMQTLGDKRYFEIIVRRGDLDLMADGLAHEYAHVIEMSKLPLKTACAKRLEHCTSWGATYSRVYRIVFQTEN